ncbi:alpha/beta-type small acid-soluble spore protein [Bacillus timonensis]|nr:alpha/beta-type small acid-soluble spore protein [Bacillus timonensis]
MKNDNMQTKEMMKKLKASVMRKRGYKVTTGQDVKYEVAKELGVLLKERDNGELTSKEAGKVGGKIGGSMVKDMVNLAKQSLNKNIE